MPLKAILLSASVLIAPVAAFAGGNMDNGGGYGDHGSGQPSASNNTNTNTSKSVSGAAAAVHNTSSNTNAVRSVSRGGAGGAGGSSSVNVTTYTTGGTGTSSMTASGTAGGAGDPNAGGGGGWGNGGGGYHEPVASAIAPALGYTANPCVGGSASMAAQAPVFGLSVGGQQMDRECQILRLPIPQAGLVAEYYLCKQGGDIRDAFFEAGTPCPEDRERYAKATAAQQPSVAPAPVPVAYHAPDWCGTASGAERRSPSFLKECH